MDWLKNFIIIFGFLIKITLSQQNSFKLCVTGKYNDECEQLQRGTSEVQCEKVQDSIECAMKLRNGEADFGVFSAESTLHIATLNWPDLTVIKQLKHKDRLKFDSDFESVVVVKSDYNGKLENLKGTKFCHPGYFYGKSQKWSERFLKHFERTVTTPICELNKSPAEIEALTLSKYFGQSCRPGKWSHDTKEDTELKLKYKSLCALCNKNGVNNCDYPDDTSINGPNNNHQKALQCIKNGGDIAYVSREDAEHFFEKEGPINSSNYRYLCPDGSLQAVIKNNFTCTWLRQPWKVIISRSTKAVPLEKLIDNWISKARNGGWESEFARIIDADSHVTTTITMEKPVEYIRTYRDIPLPESYCDTQVSWCTITDKEQDKCNVIRHGGISTGAYPLIICRDPVSNTMNCLDDINKNTSDFVGVDSNFGYLARTMYNLTAVMYYETEKRQYSSVVVVVHDNSNYRKFEDLKGSHACLPEFGATPSIAFINLGKERKFFNRKECRYHKLLHNFFGNSCAPGAQDVKHYRSANIDDPLCKLCLSEDLREHGSFNIGSQLNVSSKQFPAVSEGEITCAADESNRYYGNRGALKCLNEVGDVAILELQALKDHAKSLVLNENKFRTICHNGTLANYPGFDVDSNCPLTTIVDGEILVSRNSNKTKGIINALLALDAYFQADPDFKMYNTFSGEKNLLFKDSTIGLTAAHEQSVGQAVENYIKLFKNIEDCVQGGSATKSTLNVFILISIIFVLFRLV